MKYIKCKVHKHFKSFGRVLLYRLSGLYSHLDLHNAPLLIFVGQSEPARIYMWTVHRIEVEGADVQLYCRAAGNPAPKVTWYDRDDNKITGNNAHYKVSEAIQSSSSMD